MAVKLTPEGDCPNCALKIAKPDEKDRRRMFFRVKAMIIDQVNGTVICLCTQCKIELEMPAIKMPLKVGKKKNAPH